MKKILGLEITQNNNYKITDGTPKIIKDLFIELEKNNINNIYFIGLKTKEIPSGKKFKIGNIEGSEYIEIYNDMECFLS